MALRQNNYMVETTFFHDQENATIWIAMPKTKHDMGLQGKKEVVTSGKMTGQQKLARNTAFPQWQQAQEL